MDAPARPGLYCTADKARGRLAGGCLPFPGKTSERNVSRFPIVADASAPPRPGAGPDPAWCPIEIGCHARVPKPRRARCAEPTPGRALRNDPDGQFGYIDPLCRAVAQAGRSHGAGRAVNCPWLLREVTEGFAQRVPNVPGKPAGGIQFRPARAAQETRDPDQKR